MRTHRTLIISAFLGAGFALGGCTEALVQPEPEPTVAGVAPVKAGPSAATLAKLAREAADKGNGRDDDGGSGGWTP